MDKVQVAVDDLCAEIRGVAGECLHRRRRRQRKLSVRSSLLTLVSIP
jgi:hypothetical protein